jgi:ABC-type glycerol-3-phosphate transport system substrate-binding protein
MINRRKRLVLTAAALTATAVLAGCSTGTGNEPSADPEKASISLLAFETPALTPEFWDASIARAAEHVPGLTVQKLVASGDRNTYAKQLAATGQFPDVTTAAPPEMLGDMKPFDRDWIAENYLFPEAAAIDGVSVTPPAGAQVIPYVYYNKDLFEQVGAEVPTTWSEFERLIPLFKDAGIQPIEMVGADAWAAPYVLSGILSVDVMGSDPEWVQKRYSDKVQFTDDNIVKGVEKYRDLITAGAFGAATLSTDFTTANQQFLDGKAAMYLMGSWFSGGGYVNAEQAKFVGVFPIPSETGKVFLPLGAGGSFMVYNKSPHVDEAMKFAQAWTTDPKNYTVLIESDGLFPLLKKYKFEDYGAKTTSLYESSYAIVQDESATVVSPFSLAGNNDRFPAGLGDKFATLAQALLSDPKTDIPAQLAEIDKAWDAAPKQ